MIKKTFIILILLSSFLFAQEQIRAVPFTTGNDTIANINAADTLYYSITYSGLNWPDWIEVTQCVQDTVYITVSDKVNEATKIYDIANEAAWTWADIMKLRIVSAGDTITSNTITIGGAEGAITIFVQPDTIGTDTIYKVRVGGR